MKKKYICLAIGVVLSGVLCAQTKRVNPHQGDSTWLISKKIGQLLDETTATPIYNASEFGGIITLGIPGNYFVAENLIYPISITVGGVYLNLDGCTVTHNNSNQNVISVGAGCSDVTVNNGYVTNSGGSSGSGSGIFVDSGASSILLQDLSIFNCGAGVHCAGIYGASISACEFIDLDLSSNATGVCMDYVEETILRGCVAVKTLSTGFNLTQCTNNSLYECRALDSSGPQTVAAFRSDSGRNNLFQECVAKKTISTSEISGSQVYGFVLTGTESSTNIIECIVNDTSSTLTGSSVPYGIRMAPSFLTGDDLLATVTMTTVFRSILSVQWSPDSQHLAFSDDNKHLFLELFNGTDIIPVAMQTMSTATINAVTWSPDGQFIATGDSDYYVRVFSVAGGVLTQVAAQQTPGNRAVLCVTWSPDGQYIACGDDFSNVHVYSFDGVTLTHEAENGTPGDDVNRVTWSPDSKYIVTGSAFSSGVSSVNVFILVGIPGALQLNQLDGDNTAAGAVNSVDWSPSGQYITCGDSAGDVVVYKFDGAVLTLVNVNGSQQASLMKGVAWSPDGDYIVSCDDQGYLRAWSFDLTSTTSFVRSPGYYTEVSWSQDGQFIATSERNTPGINGAVRIYHVMRVPESCLVDGCTVCDTTGQGLLTGIGFAGAGNNFFVRNIAANNDMNYSANILNVYASMSNPPSVAQPFDNISFPKTMKE